MNRRWLKLPFRILLLTMLADSAGMYACQSNQTVPRLIDGVQYGAACQKMVEVCSLFYNA